MASPHAVVGVAPLFTAMPFIKSCALGAERESLR